MHGIFEISQCFKLLCMEFLKFLSVLNSYAWNFWSLTIVKTPMHGIFEIFQCFKPLCMEILNFFNASEPYAQNFLFILILMHKRYSNYSFQSLLLTD